MRTVARCIAVALLLTLERATPAHAQVPAPGAPVSAPETAGNELALNDVLGSVNRTFPLLRAAEIEQAIAGADVLSAEGGFDVTWKTKGTIIPIGYYESLKVDSVLEKPTALWGATAFAGYRLGRGDFPVYYGNYQTLDYGEVRAGVNVPLWRNGPIDRRRSALTKAELGREIAALGIRQQRIEYTRTAALRYFAWVAAGQRRTIAADLLRIAVSRDAALATRIQSGDLPPYEQLDNARAIEQRKAQLALAQRGLEQASIELSLMLRDASGKPLLPPAERLPSALPEPAGELGPASEDIAAASSQRVEARRLALQTKSSQVELEYSKNQLVPGIDVQVAGSRDIGPRMPSRPDLSEPILEASLLVDIPLQTRAAQGRADSATANIQKLRQQQAYASDRIEADVRDAHSAVRAARERIDTTRREVSLAVQLEQGERTRFDQGDSHLLTINIREQQTAEARLRGVDALFDYHRATTDLRAARGEDLVSGPARAR